MPDLVHEKEKLYFAISMTVSALVYVGLIAWAVFSPESIIGIGFYVVLFGLIAMITKGLLVGHLEGNGVRVSEQQFPETYQAALTICAKMEMPLPKMYVLQSGGILNAFALRFVGSNFVVINSDVLELAYEQGEVAVQFVVAHEMAHLKRRHPFWKLVLLPSNLIPFLAMAYSRGCEYTCDRFGAFYVADGANQGIALLACGKKLFRRMSREAYMKQIEQNSGFWVWYAEKLSSHPNLPKRLAAVQDLQTPRSQSATA